MYNDSSLELSYEDIAGMDEGKGEKAKNIKRAASPTPSQYSDYEEW